MNRFEIAELKELPGMYKIITDEDEMIGNILTSRQESDIICKWLNSLELERSDSNQ